MNFSKKPVVLHNLICIALGTGPSEGLQEPGRKDGSIPTVEVKEMHYRKIGDLKSRPEGQMRVENEGVGRSAHDCREKFSTDPKFDA